jgi:1-acyl-sn-glycerol-3-phosphate acyltransferase
MVRVEGVAGAVSERPGSQLAVAAETAHSAQTSRIGADGSAEGITSEGSPGRVIRRAAVSLRAGAGEGPIRFRGELLGFAERLTRARFAVLELTPSVLGLQGGAWGSRGALLDLRAVQASSSSLQVVLGDGTLFHVRFGDDSPKHWEELLHVAVQEAYRAAGRGKILEFQPRIVVGEGPREVRFGSLEENLATEPGSAPDPAEVPFEGNEAIEDARVGGGEAAFQGPNRGGPGGSPWYPLAKAALKPLVSLWTRLEVEGLRNIPASGPFILVANHQSILDPIVVQSVCPRPLHTLTKSTQFSRPLDRWLLSRVNAIPTRRYRIDAQVIRVVLRRLSEGGGVGIYPEGERSWDGSLQPFRRGTIRLLLKAGVPVVPCGIDGSYDVWPRWSRRIRRCGVRLAFGSPVRFPKLDNRWEREAALPGAEDLLRRALADLGAWI